MPNGDASLDKLADVKKGERGRRRMAAMGNIRGKLGGNCSTIGPV